MPVVRLFPDKPKDLIEIVIQVPINIMDFQESITKDVVDGFPKYAKYIGQLYNILHLLRKEPKLKNRYSFMHFYNSRDMPECLQIQLEGNEQSIEHAVELLCSSVSFPHITIPKKKNSKANDIMHKYAQLYNIPLNEKGQQNTIYNRKIASK